MRRIRRGNAARYLRFVAANVRALRLRVAWSQARLAEEADVDVRFVQRIEGARVNLSVAMLVALATALGVAPETLLDVANARGDASFDDDEPCSSIRTRTGTPAVSREPTPRRRRG